MGNSPHRLARLVAATFAAIAVGACLYMIYERATQPAPGQGGRSWSVERRG